MNQFSWKSLLPHGIAVGIFLLISVLYCKPALDGMVLTQSDIAHWKGMAKDAEDYKAIHGSYPLWTKSMFGGMPAYQITGANSNNLITPYSHKILSLFLPEPISFFFLACIGFYILAISLGVRSWIGILGSLMYAYATYNPIIIAVGHVTKMYAIAYMPALLAGVILILKKHYWIGTAMTALFSSLLISMNHLQITYYFFLMAVVLGLVYLIEFAREKAYTHLAKSVGLALIAALAGIASNAVVLLTTYDYSKATMRGGSISHAAQSDTNKNYGKGGLSVDYAFSWSYGVAETFTFLIPNFYGGSSDGGQLGEGSKVVTKLTSLGVPDDQAIQFSKSLPTYWGDQPGTSGPVYLGALTCLLFIFAMVYLKGPLKWWALAITIISVMMSWGKNFSAFNEFLFSYLPFYNKFRAPSMILVIPQLVFPMMGILALNQFLNEPDSRKDELKKVLQTTLYIAGGLIAMMFVAYISMSFTSSNDEQLKNYLLQAFGNNSEAGTSVFNAFIEDRKQLFLMDLLRSSAIMFAGIALIWTFIHQKLAVKWAAYAWIVLILIDLMPIDRRYLNSNNFIESGDYDQAFQFVPSGIDNMIQQDTSDYRVFNLSSGDPFSDAITAYHHKSVGGYHPAKLSLTEDLLNEHLRKNPLTLPILHMLNTKYIIMPGDDRKPRLQVNPEACGPVWLVKGIQQVADANAALKQIGNFNPTDTAIIESTIAKEIPAFQWDSTATIQVVKNENDYVEYSFSGNQAQFAVFSEVYYDRGWKAFIDGKEAPIYQVNYLLRGMHIPAGSKSITFSFEPTSYTTGRTLTGIGQFLMLGFVLAGIAMAYRSKKEAV
ncbi:MAG: YfhO family protein [Hydrotalea sp.]|nr:YfhO family protein [Hydrotalea sp.]